MKQLIKSITYWDHRGRPIHKIIVYQTGRAYIIDIDGKAQFEAASKTRAELESELDAILEEIIK